MKSRSVVSLALVVAAATVAVTAPAVHRMVTHISSDTRGVPAGEIVSVISARMRDVTKTPSKGQAVPGAEAVTGVQLSRGGDYAHGFFQVLLSPPLPGRQALKAANALKASGLYEAADVMYPLHTTSLSTTQDCTSAGGLTGSNDSCLTYQWWLDTIGVNPNDPATTLWGTQADTAGITVAVIDTGKTDHPDLSGQWVQGQDLIGQSRVDRGGGTYSNVDGYTSAGDGGGYDTDPTDLGTGRTLGQCNTAAIIQPSPAPARSSSWHGTAVASLIAANRNNTVGIAGVAPNVKIEPVRVLGKCTETDDSLNLVNGILWAAGETVPGTVTNTNIPQIINMSLGSQQQYIDYCPTVYQDAINTALAKGIVVIASAGNDSTAETPVDARYNTPSNCNGVISVGATTPSNTRATYSETNADLSAPGGANDGVTEHNIVVAKNTGAIDYVADDLAASPPVRGNKYIFGAGTSYSAPIVAAAVAMAMRKYSTRTFTPAAMKAALVYSASVSTQCSQCGAGILHVPTLLAKLDPTAVPSVPRSVVGAHGWTPYSGSVTWAEPSTAAWNPIDSYEVKAYLTDTGGSPVATCSTDSGTSCTLTDLSENTNYYVTVKAIRGATNSITPARAVFTTLRQAGAPTNVRATPATSSVAVTWEPPADMYDQNRVGYDEVRLYDSAVGGNQVGACFDSFYSCTISDLTPSTTYWVTAAVAVGSGDGYSKWSARVSVTTAAAPVTPVTTPPATTPPVTTTTPPAAAASPSSGSGSATPSPAVSAGPSSSNPTASAPSTASSPSSSSSAVASTSPVASVGKSVSGTSLAKSAGVSVPAGSKVSVKVPASSAKVCKISGTSVKATGAGSCRVTVTVTPKNGKATTKTVTLKVSK